MFVVFCPCLVVVNSEFVQAQLAHVRGLAQKKLEPNTSTPADVHGFVLDLADETRKREAAAAEERAAKAVASDSAAKQHKRQAKAAAAPVVAAASSSAAAPRTGRDPTAGLFDDETDSDSDARNLDWDDVVPAAGSVKRTRAVASSDDEQFDDSDEPRPAKRGTAASSRAAPKRTVATKPAARRAAKYSDDDMSDGFEELDEEEFAPAAKKKAPARAATGRGRKAATSDVEDLDDDDAAAAAKPARGRGRARGTAKATPASTGRGRGRGRGVVPPTPIVGASLSSFVVTMLSDSVIEAFCELCCRSNDTEPQSRFHACTANTSITSCAWASYPTHVWSSSSTCTITIDCQQASSLTSCCCFIVCGCIAWIRHVG